jgi:tRNA A-37 threonylcarbamoyl transferase component Bud32
MPTRSEEVLASLADKYELLQKLGEGGMGSVYLVRHKLLDQLRVVKLMHPQLGEDGTFEDRFRQEARVAAKLRHPHIAALHDFDVTASGSAYIVMEYVQGATLEAMLGTGLPPLELAVELAGHCLGALDYLHHEGFVHRDIAPDNLMVDLDRRGGPAAVLIDLGIAKRLGGEQTQQMTQAGAFLGKVTYGAPELFGSGAEPSPRTDLYSLGIVLYQMLTGRLPIESQTVAGMIGGHLFRPPLDFAESDPQGRVPTALREVVLRALAKKPDDRFAGAAEMAAALQDAMRGATRAHTVPYGTPPPAADLRTVSPTVPLMPPTAELAPAPAAAVPAADRRTAPLKPSGTVSVPVGRSRVLIGALVALGLAAVVGIGLLLPVGDRWRGDREETGRRGESAQEVPVTLPPGFAAGPGHALVIGNDDYASRRLGLQSLSSAVADARAVGEVLRTRYGYEVTRLEDATREQIMQALHELALVLGPEHNLIVYYAGHGVIDGKGHGYWLPVDAEHDNFANWIPNRDIHDVLIDVKARRVLVIADSCFAGSLAPESEEALVDEAKMFTGDARFVLTSGDLQPVPDRGSGSHSLFAGALLQELERTPGALTAGALYRRLDRRLDGSLEPQWRALAGHGQGEFVLVPRVAS